MRLMPPSASIAAAVAWLPIVMSSPVSSVMRLAKASRALHSAKERQRRDAHDEIVGLARHDALDGVHDVAADRVDTGAERVVAERIGVRREDATVVIGHAHRSHVVEVGLHDRVGGRRHHAELAPPAQNITHHRTPFVCLGAYATNRARLRAHGHMCGSVPGREDRMHPMGRPLPAMPAGTETMGPPSAVHGEMYLGSPVQPRPSGAVEGAAGHRKTSAVNALNRSRASCLSRARSSRYR